MPIQIVSGVIDVGQPFRRRYRYAMRNGERVRLRILNVDSPTFDADLLDAFRENVRRAIRENRHMVKDGTTAAKG